jgi:hypothetical protein
VGRVGEQASLLPSHWLSTLNATWTTGMTRKGAALPPSVLLSLAATGLRTYTRKTTEVPSQVNHTASLSVKGQNGSVLLQEQEQQRQNPPGPGSASWVQGLNTAHLGHLLGSFLEAELLYFFKYFIFKIGHGL